MNRLVSYSLSALVILSGCGAKPTVEKTKEVVSAPPQSTSQAATPTKEPPKEVKSTQEKKKAAPKEDKKLTSNERTQYQKHLNEGRTAHRAKDFKTAIAAFDKALALFPDDPRALSEKGWAEFADKDLVNAASDTNNAIGRTTNKDLLGSSYYNLGRIREEQAKTKEAIEAYQESLKVRPGNKIVAARLASLNGAQVERGALSGPFIGFTGPYASLKDLCKPATEEIDGESIKIVCEPEATDEDVKTIKGSGKYLAAKLFAVRVGALGEDEVDTWYTPERYYYLAVQTADGWFLSEGSNYVYSPGMFGITADLNVETFEFKDVIPGGEPELIFVSRHQRSDSDMGINELELSELKTIQICGTGPSGKLSCAVVVLKEEASRGLLFEDEEETFKADNPDFKHEGFYKNAWSLDYSFLADGKLQLRGTPNKDMSDATKAMIGTHALSFE